MISDPSKQLRGLKQALRLRGMVIWETFDLWTQNRLSWFVPIEVEHKVCACIPVPTRVRVDGREDIEQMLDIHILRPDPSRLFKSRITGTRTNRQSGDVNIFYRAEEWR